MRCVIKSTWPRKVYICLSVTSAAYSSHTCAGRVLSANLSKGPPSSVTLFQGGIANFNISSPIQELEAFLSSAQRFCEVLQTINIRVSEGLKHGCLILHLQYSENQT